MTQRLSQTAVFLGNNPEFQAFAARRMQPGAKADSDTARRYICAMCRIKSRAELNTDAEAGRRFEALRSTYRQSLKAEA